MASIINATVTSPGGLVTIGDNTNELKIQTGETDAITVDSSQNVTFAAGVAIAGTSSTSAELKLYEDTDNGTNYVALKAPDSVSSNKTITFPDGTGTVSVNGVSSNIVLDTAKASTSGTNVDFTGIPSWVKRVTVLFSGVSTNGTSNYLIQLGDSGGIENTGYVATAMAAQGASTSVVATSTAGFIVTGNVQANTQTQFGAVVINKFDGNTFVSSGTIVDASTRGNVSGGNKTLSDTLTQLRITTVNGTDTFDAGSINILYE